MRARAKFAAAGRVPEEVLGRRFHHRSENRGPPPWSEQGPAVVQRALSAGGKKRGNRVGRTKKRVIRGGRRGVPGPHRLGNRRTHEPAGGSKSGKTNVRAAGLERGGPSNEGRPMPLTNQPIWGTADWELDDACWRAYIAVRVKVIPCLFPRQKISAGRFQKEREDRGDGEAGANAKRNQRRGRVEGDYGAPGLHPLIVERLATRHCLVHGRVSRARGCTDQSRRFAYVEGSRLLHVGKRGAKTQTGFGLRGRRTREVSDGKPLHAAGSGFSFSPELPQTGSH